MKKLKILLLIILSTIATSVLGGTRIETQNTIFSNATVKITGTNTTVDQIGYGGNGLELDGSTTVDKNLLFSDGGTKTFTWMIYRNEGGKYFYLHDYQSEKQPLVISRSGRFGINKMNNILNYHTLTSDSERSSDLEIDDTVTLYTPNYQLIYLLTVTDTNDVADKYKIETSRDSGTTWTTQSTNNTMSLNSTSIENGIYIKWLAVTGHTIGEWRKFIGVPQLPRASLSVSPTFIDEVMINTNFYGTAAWVDRTYEANSSDYGTFRPYRVGTNSAMYIGMSIPNNSFYFQVVTAGVGASIVREYWAGNSWKPVSNVVDSTANLTVSGNVTFDLGLMTDWTKTNLIVDTYTNKYYWYRSYSTNAVTTEAVIQSVTRHGSKRFQVYLAPLDESPTMAVDADGYTWIGGLPLTPAIVQTFYYKFLAQCSTQTVATATNNYTPFVTEISDPYNVYSNSLWYPNSTSLVRIHWSLRAAAAENAGRGFYVVLYENGTAIRDIGLRVSGDNNDIPQDKGTYIFKPSSVNNYYGLGIRRFGGANVTLAGGNTNWWFGEKIQ